MLTAGDTHVLQVRYCALCENELADAYDWTAYITEDARVGYVHPSCYEAVVTYLAAAAHE